MNREAAKEYVKSQLTSYLEGKGVRINKAFKCVNPDHNDKNPSMSYDKRRNKVHCFSCGADYDIFDLIGIDYDLRDPKSIFEKAYQLYDVENADLSKINTAKLEQCEKTEDLRAYYSSVNANLEKTDYYLKRGISFDTAAKYRLGFDERFVTMNGTQTVEWKAVIIPTSIGSYVARNTAPDTSGNNRIRKHGHVNIFNSQAITSAQESVFVVEGEFDALSVLECGGQAIAIGSTSNVKILKSLLIEQRPKHPLILALDNDDSGRDATKQLAEILKELDIPYSIANISGEHKDPNEAHIADKGKFKLSLEKAKSISENNADDYKMLSVKYKLRSFVDGIKASVNTPAIPTGFSKLDDKLDGGFYEGLYIIGAISSLGKTTLITQIADQVAQADTDVMIFSLEMATTEIIAKSVSRHTFTRLLNGKPYNPKGDLYRNAKTVRGITTGKRYENYSEDEKKLINQAITEYHAYAGNIYIIEGDGNTTTKRIREMIDKHIQITGKRPLVLIDYLQILTPQNLQLSDKQNVDRSVMELKQISRDFKITVVGISSFNRANYNAPAAMEAFKESGAIEYSSDVLIGLQLKGANGGKPKTDVVDVNKLKDEFPRQIELKILKNRNGSIGSIDFAYYTYFNYFQEE